MQPRNVPAQNYRLATNVARHDIRFVNTPPA